MPLSVSAAVRSGSSRNRSHQPGPSATGVASATVNDRGDPSGYSTLPGEKRASGWSVRTSTPTWPLTTSTVTASGSSTRDFATYSTSSLAATARLPGRGQHARAPEEASDGLGRLGPLREPALRLGLVDVQPDGLGAGVVVADRVDRTPVAGGAAVGDHQPVGWLLGCADSCQADAHGHRMGVLLQG